MWNDKFKRYLIPGWNLMGMDICINFYPQSLYWRVDNYSTWPDPDPLPGWCGGNSYAWSDRRCQSLRSGGGCRHSTTRRPVCLLLLRRAGRNQSVYSLRCVASFVWESRQTNTWPIGPELDPANPIFTVPSVLNRSHTPSHSWHLFHIHNLPNTTQFTE
jgi:hypothetical protein